MKKQTIILVTSLFVVAVSSMFFVLRNAETPVPVASPAQAIQSNEEDIDKDLDKVNPDEFGTDDLNSDNSALDPEVQKDLNDIEKDLSSLGDNPFDTGDL